MFILLALPMPVNEASLPLAQEGAADEVRAKLGAMYEVRGFERETCGTHSYQNEVHSLLKGMMVGNVETMDVGVCPEWIGVNGSEVFNIIINAYGISWNNNDYSKSGGGSRYAFALSESWRPKKAQEFVDWVEKYRNFPDEDLINTWRLVDDGRYCLSFARHSESSKY